MHAAMCCRWSSAMALRWRMPRKRARMRLSDLTTPGLTRVFASPSRCESSPRVSSFWRSKAPRAMAARSMACSKSWFEPMSDDVCSRSCDASSAMP